MAEMNNPKGQRGGQSEQYKCGRCGEDFRSERELRNHEDQQHSDRIDRNTGDQGSRRKDKEMGK